MPRELIAIAPRQPVLREYEDGPVPADSVRVQVEFGAPKRGTELTAYYGYNNPSFPLRLGNMCVGKIIEIGDEVEGFKIGERVSQSRTSQGDTHMATQNVSSRCLIR